MHTRSLGALLVTATSVSALHDRSPFFLLSTEAINSHALHSSQIAPAETLQDGLLTALADCSAARYIVVHQPGVRTADLRHVDAMPHMQKRMADSQYKSVVQIPEVLGNMDADRVVEGLNEMCEAKGNSPSTTNWRFPIIMDTETETGRKSMLDEIDAVIHQDLTALLSNHTSHVLIFTSKSAAAALAKADYDTPHHVEMDEPPFQESMHTDLKRDVQQGTRRRRQAKNADNFQDGLPLFEKYQFLSPGIFMGLTISLLLFMILYVGISSIAGLQVSYMAFSKEMGPQAQKKQQ